MSDASINYQKAFNHLQYHAHHMNTWEQGFVDSLEHQFKQKGTLSISQDRHFHIKKYIHLPITNPFFHTWWINECRIQNIPFETNVNLYGNHYPLLNFLQFQKFFGHILSYTDRILMIFAPFESAFQSAFQWCKNHQSPIGVA